MGIRIDQSWHPISYGRDNSLTDYTGHCDALLVSQGNPMKNGKYTRGGPFYMCRRERHLVTGQAVTHQRNGVVWSGTLGPATASLPTVVRLSGASASNAGNAATAMGVSSYGSAASDAVFAGHFASGFNKTRPGQPVADLGQFLWELRDFPTVYGKAVLGATVGSIKNFRYIPGYLKSLPLRDVGGMAERIARVFKALGSEYLNHVFGWAPFVNDLQKIYHLMKSVDKQMAQIVKDNRKGISRRATISEDRTSSTFSQSYPYAIYNSGPPNWTAGTGSQSYTVTSTKKVWYMAKYSYYIPDTNSWGWNAKARAALFGALPTPGLLYAVTPWSWMQDWFLNVGDVLNNASSNAVDNLVCHYAYVMIHLRQDMTSALQGSWSGRHDSGGEIDAGSCNVIGRGKFEYKLRIPQYAGLVFFPGVGTGDFSPRQAAIAASLGLTRLPV